MFVLSPPHILDFAAVFDIAMNADKDRFRALRGLDTAVRPLPMKAGDAGETSGGDG
jgi:hypothetical protein